MAGRWKICAKEREERIGSSVAAAIATQKIAILWDFGDL